MTEQEKMDLVRAELVRLMDMLDKDGYPVQAYKLAQAIEVIDFCVEMDS